MDDETKGRRARLDQLRDACLIASVQPPSEKDRVALIVPARNIETWLSYLMGGEVDEASCYPRLEYPSDCRRHARALQQMCLADQLRTPAPASLMDACREFRRIKP